MIKKLWNIVDSPKTESKEKIKAITLIGQCYKERFELIRSEPSLIQHNRHMDHVERSYENVMIIFLILMVLQDGNIELNHRYD
jgi:hypothetical protein